jgi:hypothetical protein
MNKIAKYCNCRTEDNCPCPGDGHECCSQKVVGKDPTFGLWMMKGSCDQRTGLPKDAHLHRENKIISEGFVHGSREGYRSYDDDEDSDGCDEWRKAFNVLIVIILVAIIGCSAIYLKSKAST